MSITALGALNTTALQVADVYVQIVPPQFLLNGVPSNIAGLVGTAVWGAVNTPVIIGSPAQFVQSFGPLQARKYDMGTHVFIAFQQGASAMKCVRVTDGTDTAASAAVQATGITFTSIWTGSGGNTAVVTVGPGSKQGTAQVRVAMVGTAPEIFDNIGPGLTANAMWLAIATAVNSGISSQRGPSLLVTAVAGASTSPVTGVALQATGTLTFAANPIAAATVAINGTTITFVASNPVGNQVLVGGTQAITLASLVALINGSADVNLVKVKTTTNGTIVTITAVIVGTAGNAYTLAASLATPSAATLLGGVASAAGASYALAGGTDGVGTINGTVLLGVDSLPRTGMYALRSSDASVIDLCDNDDITTWSTQDAYCGSESCYGIVVGTAGQSIAAAVAAKAAAGIDTYALKVLLGDWAYWNDTVNGLPNRLVSPQSYVVGKLAALSPQNSTLNKAMTAIVGTQKSATGSPYTGADLQSLVQGGIDVISNPAPGGNYFACRTGHNASSSVVVRGDNYTRMTNYIATTLNRGMGIYVGQLQSRDPNDPTRRRAKATLDTFLDGMQQQNQIDSFQGQLDRGNNPDGRIATGYMQADYKVVYLAVVEFFLINLEGGQSVVITKTATQPQ